MVNFFRFHFVRGLLVDRTEILFLFFRFLRVCVCGARKFVIFPIDFSLYWCILVPIDFACLANVNVYSILTTNFGIKVLR